MEETILTWNVANWITVVLMAGVGFFALGLVQKWAASKSGDNATTA